MKKLPASKITILMVVLVLVGSSMACRIAEVLEVGINEALENCYEVSREEYEYYAERLGETPKTPKHPESAVYEVCHRKNFIEDEWELISVRMSEGYRDEDENSEPAKSDRAITIPSGTYRGEFPGLENIVDYLVNQNEIIIEISPNGVVSGFAVMHIHKTEEFLLWDSEKQQQVLHCIKYYEEKTTYTVSGQIHGWLDQPVEVKRTFYRIADTSTCKYGENRIRDEECTCEGKLTVRDGALTITCGRSNPDCGAYLTGK